MAETNMSDEDLNLLDLPHEVLIKICSFLDDWEKVSFALSCKTVKMAAYSRPLWKKRVVVTSLPDCIEGWPDLYSSLEERGISFLAFTLENYAAFDAHLTLIAQYWPGVSVMIEVTKGAQGVPGMSGSLGGLQLNNVTRLKLFSINVAFVKLLKNLMPSLEFLDVRESQFCNDCASALASSNQLRCLRASGTALTDIGVGFLCGYTIENLGFKFYSTAPLLTNLTVLEITNNMIVSSRCWRFLKRLQRLTILVMKDFSIASYIDFQQLSKIRSLRCLVVKNSLLSNKFLFDLCWSGCRLQCLSINSCYDDGMYSLIGGFSEVLYLKLPSSLITDNGVNTICDSLPQLLLLDLRGCHFLTDQSLIFIADKLRNLRYLCVLDNDNLTEAQIARMPVECCVVSRLGRSRDNIDLPRDDFPLLWFCFSYLNYENLEF